MQELLAKLNDVKPTQFCSIDTIRDWAQQLLEKEKEQIMKAWYNGFEENRPYIDHSEDYYNETYGI